MGLLAAVVGLTGLTCNGSGAGQSVDGTVAQSASALQASGLPVFNVLDYGVHNDGTCGSNSAGIQNAIADALSSATNNHVVYFPSGTYCLESTINNSNGSDWSGLTLLGAADSTLVSKPTSGNPGFNGVLLVVINANRVRIEKLNFVDGVNLCASSSGLALVQVGWSNDVIVRDVSVNGNATSSSTNLCDGLAFTVCTSAHAQHVKTSFTSKLGIYVAGGRDVSIEDCETSNTLNSVALSVPPAGIGIANATDVAILHSRAHDNQGPGILIENQTTGSTVSQILVDGCEVRNNGAGSYGVFAYNSGIYLDSEAPGARPQDITVSNLQAFGNAGYGIAIQAGFNISIDNPMLTGNGKGGFFLYQWADPPPTQRITSRVHVSGGTIRGSSPAAILSVPAMAGQFPMDDISFVGTRIDASTPPAFQIYCGWGGNPVACPAGASAPTNVRLVDVHGPVLEQGSNWFDFSQGPPPLTGYYHLVEDGAATQTPNGRLYAPPGSEYAPLGAFGGGHWRKTSAGSLNSGWVQDVASMAAYRMGNSYTITSNGNYQVLNFSVMDWDNDSDVTTGAGWKFTCPTSGIYRVSATVAVTWGSAAGNVFLSATKNGVVMRALAMYAPANVTNGGSLVGEIQCAAGDTLDVRVLNTTSDPITLDPSNFPQYVQIERMPGS